MYCILLSIFCPILAGIFLLIRYRTPLSGKRNPQERKTLLLFTGTFLILTALLTVTSLLTAKEGITLLYLTDTLPIYFKIDAIGALFSLLAVIVLVCAGFFSFEYMKHEERESRYYGFYLMMFGVLNALCFAGNLITFYLFFELLTLSSMPLVLHSGTKEAVMAGLKYLFYSLCGAYASLYGVYFLYQNCETLTFTGERCPESLRSCRTWRLSPDRSLYYDSRFWCKSGHVSHARLAAHGASGGACSRFRRLIRNNRQSGRSRAHSGDESVWHRLSARDPDSDRLDLPDSDHGIYGVAACLSRTCFEKEACLLHGESALLHSIWSGLDAGDRF